MPEASLSQVSSILAQLAEFRDEIQVDAAGYAYTSVRGAARLCGCSRATLDESREGKSPGYLQKLAAGKDLPECLQPFAGLDCKAAGNIPDTLVAAFIYYFAVEAKQTNEVAKANLKALAGVSLRELFVRVKRDFTVPTPNKPGKPYNPRKTAKARAIAYADIFADENKPNLRSKKRMEQLLEAIKEAGRPVTADELGLQFDLATCGVRDYLNALVVAGRLARKKDYVSSLKGVRMVYFPIEFIEEGEGAEVEEEEETTSVVKLSRYPLKRSYNPQVSVALTNFARPVSSPDSREATINRLLDLLEEAEENPKAQARLDCLLRLL